jgi:hypothetical protein
LTIVGFVLVLLLLMQYLRQLQPMGARELTYTALVNAVDQRTIAEATVQGNRLVGTLRDGRRSTPRCPRKAPLATRSTSG